MTANKKLKALTLVLVTALIILSGCNKSSSELPYVETHKGTAAFTMNYLENAPPPKVFAPDPGKESKFEVGIRMQNQGAYDISEGYLNLVLEKNYMRFIEWGAEDESMAQVGGSGEKITFDLEGKSQLNPYGGEKIITATITSLPIDVQTETHVSSILAVACYEYSTEASAEVCIDTDVYNLRPVEKVCSAKDVSLSGGQGAPVEITKIEVKMLPGEGNSVNPQFIIYVRNAGNGEAVSKDKVSEACSSEPLAHEDINIIDIEDIGFSGFSKRDFECSPERLKLKGGTGYFRCTLKEGKLTPETQTYQTPLIIKLKYGYTFTVSKSIVLEKILKY